MPSDSYSRDSARTRVRSMEKQSEKRKKLGTIIPPSAMTHYAETVGANNPILYRLVSPCPGEVSSMTLVIDELVGEAEVVVTSELDGGATDLRFQVTQGENFFDTPAFIPARAVKITISLRKRDGHEFERARGVWFSALFRTQPMFGDIKILELNDG